MNIYCSHLHGKKKKKLNTHITIGLEQEWKRGTYPVEKAIFVSVSKNQRNLMLAFSVIKDMQTGSVSLESS